MKRRMAKPALLLQSESLFLTRKKINIHIGSRQHLYTEEIGGQKAWLDLDMVKKGLLHKLKKKKLSALHVIEECNPVVFAPILALKSPG